MPGSLQLQVLPLVGRRTAELLPTYYVRRFARPSPPSKWVHAPLPSLPHPKRCPSLRQQLRNMSSSLCSTMLDGRTRTDERPRIKSWGRRRRERGTRARADRRRCCGWVLFFYAARRDGPHPTHTSYLHLPAPRYMPFSEAVWSGRARASGRR